MGVTRTLGAATVVPGTPTPVLFAAAGYTGVKIAAVSFSILHNIATVVLGPGNLPQNGYNGPNGYPVQLPTIPSPTPVNPPAQTYQAVQVKIFNGGTYGQGQQVTLWGFTTATYFNGKRITVLDCDPVAGSFRFAFTHADVASTADSTGRTAPSPFQHYRAIRLECGLSNGTDFVYVGDLNVSSSRYQTALSIAGLIGTEISSDNIPVECVMIDGTADTDTVQVALIY